MQITIVKVGNVETVPGKGGRPYKRLEVLYKNMKGDTYPKQLMSFKNPTVFKVMSEAKDGEIYEIASVKNDAGYIDWISANLVGNADGGLPAVNAKGEGVKAAVRVTVTEHDRNRYIVRQSSLQRAVELLTANTGTFSVKDVTDTAAQFENWVFRALIAESPVKQVVAAPAVEVAQEPTIRRGRPRKVVVEEPVESQSGGFSIDQAEPEVE